MSIAFLFNSPPPHTWGMETVSLGYKVLQGVCEVQVNARSIPHPIPTCLPCSPHPNLLYPYPYPPAPTPTPLPLPQPLPVLVESVFQLLHAACAVVCEDLDEQLAASRSPGLIRALRTE